MLRRPRLRVRPLSRSRLVAIAAGLSLFPASVLAQSFPGGFLQHATSTASRPPLTQAQIQAFLPTRGGFTFPVPYNTRGARLTTSSDCGGADCVDYVGYAYWRNINNHVGSDTMLIFVGLDRSRGGTGPTLFSYNKVTEEVRNLGPLFDATSPHSWATGEGWYFSATRPTTLYLNDGPRLLRYDVATRQFQTVFDVAAQFGTDKFIWQTHSSNDDVVHSATLRQTGTWAMLGCLVFREDTRQFSYFPATAAFDECQLDKSGRWLTIKEQIDGLYEQDVLIVDLQTGTQTVLLDQNGAPGHSDTGYGYMVGADNWNALPNAWRLWTFGQNPLQGPLVYAGTEWGSFTPAHVSHSNARAGVAPGQQYACGSSANRVTAPFSNEIICFRLDGSLDVLVAAPVMTSLDAPGGGSDDYAKMPKGNLDVTGQYFVWTSNMAGGRLDAFVVKVPAQLLATDIAPPTVSILTPLAGATVAGTTTVSAGAADNAGVAGVQFKLDGANLGSEITTAPYARAWTTTTALNGAHTVTAVARDRKGNSATSAPISVTVANGDTVPPAVAITSPLTGSSLSGNVTLSATATDNVQVFGVQFKLDGVNLGPEVTTPPYSVSWTTKTAANGSHSLTAVARDAAGNSTRSIAVNVSVQNDLTAPVISLVSSSSTSSGATVTWATNEPSSSQVEYGPTTAYGRVTTLDTRMLTAHSQTLAALTAGTRYHYRVKSRDGAGNLATSGDLTFTTLGTAPAPSTSALSVESVVWANIVNATATGSSLSKTSGCDGCADAGGTSTQQITSGDGYVEFTAADATKLRWAGLSRGNAGTGYDGIAFAVRLQAGIAEVRELGVYRTDTRAAAGDVFRVAVQSGVVRYYKNGVVFYTSGVAPAYPLLLDASLADLGATVGSAKIARLTTVQSAAVQGGAVQSVVWANIVNASATGSSLSKTSGCDGCADAGGTSTQQITSGDGYVEFTATDATKLRWVGLSRGNAGTNADTIAFAVRLQAGIAEVRELGVYRTDTRAAAGDVFRVAVQSGVILYYKNGVVFYTSRVAPAYPLLLDTSLADLAATVANAKIAGGR